MGDTDYIKRVTIAGILLGLFVVSFFLIRPILYSIITGVILGIMFHPVYRWLNKNTNMENLSAFVVCIILFILILIPLWFLTPIIVKQAFEVFKASQQIDFVTPLKNLFPQVFASESFSNEFGSTISSFTTKLTSSIVDAFSKIILNFTTIFLQLLIVFFTLFFVLRDKEEIMSYIKSLSPFPKDTEKKLFKSTKDITLSVLYGRIALGIVQGLIAGIGFFVFGVPNALLLMIFASLAGVLPIVGTVIIWLPVAIFYFATGEAIVALGIIGFGVLATIFESVLQPIFISRMIKMNSSVALIGMIGGLLTFGIIGVIIGPLIIAYLLIILEIYRNKKFSVFSKK